MRLYGGKFLRNKVGRMQEARIETRDALLWSVDDSNRTATIKIQGSDTQILAYFPQNWKTTPTWLKPGNAVRVVHVGGDRGRIELAGHGLLKPTAVEGGDVTVTLPGLGNAIMSGCAVKAKPNTPGMGVLVTTGSVRVDQVTYALSAMYMGNEDYVMGDGGKMNEIAACLPLAAADSTNFRYDSVILEIGSDEVADVYISEGDEFAGPADAEDPPEPTPGLELRLNFILIWPDMTEVTQEYVGKQFSTPIPCMIELTVDDEDMYWATLDTNINIAVKDQYGNNISPSGYGEFYHFTASFLQGNGNLRQYSYSTPSETSIEFDLYSATGSIIFTRNQASDDSSPIIQITAELEYEITNVIPIFLYDDSGYVMY